MKPICDCNTLLPESSRRKFLKVAALGAGVSLLSPLALMSEARAAGSTDALLLSCMDYRLMDDVARYMSQRGLENKYDHVILAGASLGAVTDKFPAWNTTFWEHLDVAIKLHNIPRVIVLDHRDCGAYKVVLGAEHAKTPQTETAAHLAQLDKLKGMIKAKYPKLEVETLLMGLDGKVEVLGNAKAA